MSKTYKLKKGYRLVAYGNTKHQATSGILNNMFELQDEQGNEIEYVGNLNVIIAKYNKYFTKTLLNELAESY